MKDTPQKRTGKSARSKVTDQGTARRVTMTDVAVAAGCSQATVSIVLKNAPGVKISTDTRKRVIEAAIRLGYSAATFVHQKPQANAAPNSAPVVGFIVDQLATSPEAVIAIDAARQACWNSGQILLSGQTMHDSEMEEKTVRTLVANGMTGLIYMTIFTRRVELPEVLLDLSVPVVLLNCHSSNGHLPAVVPDEFTGGRRAAQHLVDMGHRRIGMITGEPWMEATRDRQKGYKRTLADANIPFDPDLVINGNWTPSSGYEGTRKLLALAKRPTAIFCQNDRMAIGCYEALKEAGLHIPTDISVMGYDDEEIARHLHPPLSTVNLPHRAMGAWAVECLERGKEANSRKITPTRIDCGLVLRNSVAPPAR